MSTYTQILYQLVFATKDRENTLLKEKRRDLYKYIYGLLKNKKCHLYRIGGVDNHMHIITHIHPTIALSQLIKDIKLSSSDYIKRENLLTKFDGWQEGYSAFTYSIDSKDSLIEYVKRQEEHHKMKTFTEELIELFEEHQIPFDERYLI